MGHDPLPASLHTPSGHGGFRAHAEILGGQMFEHFLRNKRAEWQDYRPR